MQETASASREDERVIPRELTLKLRVTDHDVLHALLKEPEGAVRDALALSALRVGILAFRQANGAVDAGAIRHEGEHLVAEIRSFLVAHTAQFGTSIKEALTRYFDPADGELAHRLERLLEKDGELEQVLARHVNGGSSTLAGTLDARIGPDSPLLRLLSPDESGGVLANLRSAMQAALKEQREVMLRQFSLDDKTSALSRLVGDITGVNGKLKEELAKDLSNVRMEFSLDNPDGALARLVARVELAHSKISNEFSTDNEQSAISRLTTLLQTTNGKIDASLTLDDEKSPLSRLQRELLKVLVEVKRSQTDFQTEVKATLESYKARREEAARSTRHGPDFEAAVNEMLQHEAQRLGDVFEATGHKFGRQGKVGDEVITLGPDSLAPGERIACEAKENRSYDLKAALVEIKQTRENRGASTGVFVFSKATAPAGMEPFARYGEDVIVVWDRDDITTDVYLRAAISVARALVCRARVASHQTKAEFDVIDDAIKQVAAAAATLESIQSMASTVEKNGKKIGDKAEKLRESLDHQVEKLRNHVDRLKDDAK